ncbi:MAG: F0F1 ATP synthase subunit delta [Candidatus Omnitrophica bacterium]|nr:F0F1 ATP synthase subunit delta [Candidatus Omnitrophota bacterium]
MEFHTLIISFLVLMVIVLVPLIFILRRTLVSSTEGAVKRLNDEIAKTGEKQRELNKKLQEADEELAKRRAEAKELADKMRIEAEQDTKKEREEIIGEARKEGEEIIAKAQISAEKLKVELEKEMDKKAVIFASDLLTKVLSEKAKGALDNLLIAEYLDKLKGIDMSNISPDVKEVEVISLTPLDDSTKKTISSIIESKIKRTLSIKETINKGLGGGLMLKFGSMALDGSLQFIIREEAMKVQQSIESTA